LRSLVSYLSRKDDHLNFRLQLLSRFLDSCSTRAAMRSCRLNRAAASS
jgi:pyrroloquinoline quinone (PQQ) biosynthesis protein C